MPGRPRFPVRTDPGQPQGGGDIHVRRESGGTFPGRAFEHLQRRVQPVDGNAVFVQIRRAFQGKRRLARYHADFVNLAFGGRADGVEPEQCAGRENDLRIMGTRDIDNVGMDQKTCAADGDEGPGTGAQMPSILRRALSWSREQIAASSRPSIPLSSAAATGLPIVPKPAIPTFTSLSLFLRDLPQA